MTSASSPRVSVVMSAYNDAAHLEASIQSIRQQTFTDWELIVVNDGSTDSTGAILDSSAAEDPRIRVIHQENTGLTRALIRGCQEARGEFIARQDADDTSHPERLAEQVKLLSSRPELGFVSCWTAYVAPCGELLEVVQRTDDCVAATKGLLHDGQGPPAHGSIMFRAALYTAVGGYRAEFFFAQDCDLWFRMAECSQIGYVPRVLYFFLRNPKGISGTQGRHQRRLGELGKLASQARMSGLSEMGYLAEAEAIRCEVIAGREGSSPVGAQSVDMDYLVGSQLSRKGRLSGAKYLASVVRRRPFHWKAWVRLLQLPVHALSRCINCHGSKQFVSSAAIPDNRGCSSRSE